MFLHDVHPSAILDKSDSENLEDAEPDAKLNRRAERGRRTMAAVTCTRAHTNEIKESDVSIEPICSSLERFAPYKSAPKSPAP